MLKKMFNSKIFASLLIILGILMAVKVYQIGSGLSYLDVLKKESLFIVPFVIFLINYTFFFDFLKEKKPKILKEIASKSLSKPIKFTDIGILDFLVYCFKVRKEDDAQIKLYKIVYIVSLILMVIGAIILIVR